MLDQAAVERLLQQSNGVECVIALLRDGRIEWSVAASAMSRWDEMRKQRLRRFWLTVGDTLFGR